MRQLPAAEFIERRKDEPIVLVGDPSRLTGRIPLHNRAGERVVLRQAQLHGTAHYGVAGAARSARAYHLPVQMTAVLSPDERAQVPVRVSLDPYTPPGHYTAELSIGDHRYPVELHVAERVDLQIAPGRLLVENRPGRQRKQLILSNRGNVPVGLGSIGAVPLDDELAECKTLRATLAAGKDRAHSLDDWLTGFLNQGKKHLDSVGMLWVEVEDAPLQIAPGATVTAALNVRVPDSLDPRSRYLGVAFLYDNNLRFEVVPTGHHGQAPERIGKGGDAEAGAAPSTAKKRKRRAE
jgi:hypothetical protein